MQENKILPDDQYQKMIEQLNLKHLTSGDGELSNLVEEDFFEDLDK